MTAAFVVTWRGRLIAERYGNGITARTPLEGWSMGKSLTATLMGVLIKQGVYDLWQPAPIPEWQSAGDPRAKIRDRRLMHMSSGLRISAPQDPDYDPAGTYPDHLYLYTGSVNSFHYAATRPLQWPPNTIGRYRNTDPVLDQLSHSPRRREAWRGLFVVSAARAVRQDRHPHDGDRDRPVTGIFSRRATSSLAGATGRASAIFILQDGVWNGERILPEGYAKFVSTLAPAWEADKRPIYGGFFWINGDGTLPGDQGGVLYVGSGRADDLDHSIARSRRGAPRPL